MAGGTASRPPDGASVRPPRDWPTPAARTCWAKGGCEPDVLLGVVSGPPFIWFFFYIFLTFI